MSKSSTVRFENVDNHGRVALHTGKPDYHPQISRYYFRPISDGNETCILSTKSDCFFKESPSRCFAGR